MALERSSHGKDGNGEEDEGEEEECDCEGLYNYCMKDKKWFY